MNIVLIGFMGCGKSTAARRLASALGYELVETDERIEREQGRSIARIFAEEGEQAFRAMERALAEQLANRDQCVISTGGGMILPADTRGFLKANGTAVFVDTPFSYCYRRIAGDKARPNAAARTRDELYRLYLSRLPVYREAADCTVDGKLSAAKLTEGILAALKLQAQ